jgi:hypothetical protein
MAISLLPIDPNHLFATVCCAGAVIVLVTVETRVWMTVVGLTDDCIIVDTRTAVTVTSRACCVTVETRTAVMVVDRTRADIVLTRVWITVDVGPERTDVIVVMRCWTTFDVATA